MENPELELARRFVERTATSVFLTGKAGTGKTTFLRELRARSPKRMIVLAPTGVAAINAGGVTIHSFFQLAFAPYVPESERGIAPDRPREAVRFSRQKIAIIKSIDLLVIDEISMVRADVLDAVSDVLRRFRDRRKPFGGVQLLLIGDVQQLAPVVRDEEWALLRTFYDSPFFFDSKALKQTDYVGIELQRVYRQSDGRFVELLNRVRDGRVDRNVLDELNRRYVPGFRPGDDEGYITLTSHNHTADAINERRLAELDAPSHTFEAEIEGAFPEYLYPTHPSLTLRKGAQVMFVKNDPSPEKRYYNGRIGAVTALDENRVEVLPRGESIPIAVEPAEWTNAKYVIDPDSKEISERIEGRFVQYPLRTAWAITIHKSQGLTFDRAVIDAAASFSHGQVYVALSRCRSLDGLVLSSPLDERCIVGDPTVQGFCERVSSERPDGTELERRSRAYYRDLLLELFDFDSLGASLRRLGDFVAEHFGKLYPKLALQWQQGTAEFGASVTDVARRFRLQLESLLRSDESERLRERVVKGAAYFAEQCGRVVAPLIEASYVETDSKETRKALAGLLDLSGERLRVKTATLEAASGGFDVFRHLEARARVAAEGAAARTKKETKATAGEDVLHPELFERLRLWRREQAAEAGVPAYVVMSQQALLDSLQLEIHQAALHSRRLILAPGNYGLDYLAQNYPELHEIPIVKVSNFIGEALDMAAAEHFAEVLLVGHVGKLVKLAGGIMNTHSKQADCRTELFCTHAALCGADTATCRALMDAATTDACLDILTVANLKQTVMASLLQAIQLHLDRRAAEAFTVGAILFSNQNGPLGQTQQAEKLLQSWKEN